tara:strand:- start:2208 stop:2393 length:186 start_codon:yes stop_codon:yes gene_type:complete
MTVSEKEKLISEMYSMLNKHWMENLDQFDAKAITYEEYQKTNFPAGAIQKLTTIIRNFKGE